MGVLYPKVFESSRLEWLPNPSKIGHQFGHQDWELSCAKQSLLITSARLPMLVFEVFFALERNREGFLAPLILFGRMWARQT